MPKTLQQAAEALFPRSRVKEFAPYWPGVESYADLSTPHRKAMFLAQFAVESAYFVRMVENLNYSTVGLRQTFKPHRITDEQIAKYGRVGKQKADQVALANILYGGEYGRVNLGNTRGPGENYAGDGWTYRGRGGGLTGRANYQRATDSIGDKFGVDFVKEPDLAALPKYAAYAFAGFWRDKKINDFPAMGGKVQPKGYSRPLTGEEWATYKINGALSHHKERMALYVAALNLLT